MTWSVVRWPSPPRPTKRSTSGSPEAAKADNVPVNVVDNPALCSFIMPSVVDRDPVQIAVSTAGPRRSWPGCCGLNWKPMIPASYGRLATVVREFRGRVKQRLS